MLWKSNSAIAVFLGALIGAPFRCYDFRTGRGAPVNNRINTGGQWCGAESDSRENISSGSLDLVGANKKVGRNLPSLSDLVDHLHRERAPTRKDFRCT